MVKIEILPTFIQRPKINYSTYEKIVSGELKGPFELHLDVNDCVGNKKSTIIDQNFYHQKGLIVSCYKKHFYHFLIRRILFSISSFLSWEYARTPLENLTFIWSIFMKIYFQPHLMVFYTLSGKFKGHVSQCFSFQNLITCSSGKS